MIYLPTLSLIKLFIWHIYHPRYHSIRYWILLSFIIMKRHWILAQWSRWYLRLRFLWILNVLIRVRLLIIWRILMKFSIIIRIQMGEYAVEVLCMSLANLNLAILSGKIPLLYFKVLMLWSRIKFLRKSWLERRKKGFALRIWILLNFPIKMNAF